MKVGRKTAREGHLAVGASPRAELGTTFKQARDVIKGGAGLGEVSRKIQSNRSCKSNCHLISPPVSGTQSVLHAKEEPGPIQAPSAPHAVIGIHSLGGTDLESQWDENE
jgi:hypothetical protein